MQQILLIFWEKNTYTTLLGPTRLLIFKLSGQFHFSRHPWGPWGCLSIGVIWNETKISCSGHCVFVEHNLIFGMVGLIKNKVGKNVAVNIQLYILKFHFFLKLHLCTGPYMYIMLKVSKS